MATQADRLFLAAFNGSPNFMTPDVLSRTLAGPFAVEIAKGRGFDGDPIYGVTVIERETGLHRTDIGQVFFSQNAAEGYVVDLEDGVYGA